MNLRAALNCIRKINSEWIHKYIVGHKGVEINKLRMEYPHVHIKFIENKIKIEGPPEQVKRVREQLDGLMYQIGKLETNIESDAVISRSSLEVNILYL